MLFDSDNSESLRFVEIINCMLDKVVKVADTPPRMDDSLVVEK